MLGNFPTPTMDFLIRWHQKPMGLQFLTPEGQLNPQLLERTGAPYKYGIHCLEVCAARVTAIVRPTAHFLSTPGRHTPGEA